MKCLHPREVKNKVTGRFILVPCRKCPACLHNKQKEWAYRLMQEQRYSKYHSLFITLTFDDLLVGDNDYAAQLNPKLLSDFIKRLRRYLDYHNINKELRLFAAGEYGDLGRAHYHLVVFDINLSCKSFTDVLQKLWPYGFVTVSYVNDARLMYVAKYTCKQLFINDPLFKDKKVLPFSYISKGRSKGKWLGYKFLADKNLVSRIHEESMFSVLSSNGSLFKLPDAYKRRIFSAGERELHNDLMYGMCPDYTTNYKKLLNKKSVYERQFESQFWKRIRNERKTRFGCQQESVLSEYEE